jgi:hypothetical protein
MRSPRLLLGLLLSLAITVGCDRAESPEQVRKAVLDAGVIGQPPVEVERRLHDLRFDDGRHLAVNSFDPSRLVVTASMRDSQGRPGEKWNVDVVVTFDSTRKAVAVEARDTAVNPL